MTESSIALQDAAAAAAEPEEFGVAMPPNARIGTLVFDDPQRRLRVQLADGGDERFVAAEDVRALFGEWPLFKVGYMEIEVFALYPYAGFAGG